MVVKVSIIIPAYNIAPYIGRCLDSVLGQTLKEIEIIVVDDGSTDSTVEKVREYIAKDKRIKLFQKENGGVSSARLTGVCNATGEYIGFVDGDDWIENDMFERLLDNAIKYQADISHCGYQMVFPNRVDYYYNTGRLIKQDKITGLKDLLRGSFVEPGLWNKLFRRSMFFNLLDSALMDLKVKNNEDLLMNYYLFRESCCAVYEDWCPYHYLVRNNSATSAPLSAQKLTDPIRVLNRLETETVGETELQQIILQRLTNQLIKLSSVNMNHQKELLAVQKKARKIIKSRLWEILKCPVCKKRSKFSALWVSIWPWSYGVVHKVYAVITGIDKKYLIE